MGSEVTRAFGEVAADQQLGLLRRLLDLGDGFIQLLDGLCFQQGGPLCTGTIFSTFVHGFAVVLCGNSDFLEQFFWQAVHHELRRFGFAFELNVPFLGPTNFQPSQNRLRATGQDSVLPS